MGRIRILSIRVVAALVVVAALAIRAASGRGQGELVRSLEKAETSENWKQLLKVCLSHATSVRAESEFLVRCGQAAERVAEGVEEPIGASEAAASIRALAAWGDREVLAEALDRSRVVVPAGEFIMGSNEGRENEKPEHRVYVDAFAIGRFEVTNVQYARFVEAAGQHPPRYWPKGESPAGQEDVPVVGVEWAEAQAYCQWIGGRLPTEAEWEKACRGETAAIYPWGNEWDTSRANISLGIERASGTYLSALYEILLATPAAGMPGLLPIGSFPLGASSTGLLDLAGNASEWVADWYNWDGYWDMPTVNPLGVGPEWNRSHRGSSWFFRMGMEGDTAFWSRCSARNSSHAWIDPRVGFRCAYPAP
jgi:formylglycine-generating enzyme required for sulfatase activity